MTCPRPYRLGLCSIRQLVLLNTSSIFQSSSFLPKAREGTTLPGEGRETPWDAVPPSTGLAQHTLRVRGSQASAGPRWPGQTGHPQPLTHGHGSSLRTVWWPMAPSQTDLQTQRGCADVCYLCNPRPSLADSQPSAGASHQTQDSGGQDGTPRHTTRTRRHLASRNVLIVVREGGDLCRLIRHSFKMRCA